MENLHWRYQILVQNLAHPNVGFPHHIFYLFLMEKCSSTTLFLEIPRKNAHDRLLFQRMVLNAFGLNSLKAEGKLTEWKSSFSSIPQLLDLNSSRQTTLSITSNITWAGFKYLIEQVNHEQSATYNCSPSCKQQCARTNNRTWKWWKWRTPWQEEKLLQRIRQMHLRMLRQRCLGKLLHIDICNIMNTTFLSFSLRVFAGFTAETCPLQAYR